MIKLKQIIGSNGRLQEIPFSSLQSVLHIKKKFNSFKNANEISVLSYTELILPEIVLIKLPTHSISKQATNGLRRDLRNVLNAV